MGDIIGGLIGAAGSLFGGSSASKQALTGYKYLTGKNGIQSYVNNGRNANTDAYGALTSQDSPGFKNYLNSTGYNFALDQGSRAITGSAAARGLLNSGSTAKALTQYGQNTAQKYFSDYLGQLGDVANRGLTASGQIGSAGTQGGATAAQATAGGIGAATGDLQGIVNPILNYFGQV